MGHEGAFEVVEVFRRVVGSFTFVYTIILIIPDAQAWGEKHGTGDTIMLLADGDGSWTKAAGLDQELPGLVCAMHHDSHVLFTHVHPLYPFPQGTRSLRYALLVDNGIVKVANIEDKGGKNYTISGPETMLKSIEELRDGGKET